MNLDKLKEAARRHELREEWRKAIEIYQRALADLTQAGEPGDPSLYNRIGDLEIKAGEPVQALRAYEMAADTYADQGFFNNAIALCGKILRVNPGRTATYLRLAELHARKNVIAEAKRNLLEYVDRMASSGQLDAMIPALRSFGQRFSGSTELRAVLGEILATAGHRPEGREEFERLAGELGLDEAPQVAGLHQHREPVAPGGLVFIDTGIDTPGPVAGAGTGSAAETSDAIETLGSMDLIDPSAMELRGPVAAVTMAPSLDSVEIGGFEPTLLAPDSLEAALGAASFMAVPESQPAGTIPGLEPLSMFGLSAEEELSIEPISLQDGAVLPDLLFDTLDVQEEIAAERAEAGRHASVGALEAAASAAVVEERWDEALECLAELIRREPEAVQRHQERVEVAYRSGDRIQLVAAYLSLAQALERAGAHENAILVYQRVVEHDSFNPVAAGAIARLHTAVEAEGRPPAATAGAFGGGQDEFMDLGALILEPEPTRDTRMRVDQGEPEKEEDVDFRETLTQFKLGIEANIDAGDFQAHYDLGIAFKEMGLLDEAIAQFQKALKSPEGRLKGSEALGSSFFEKGRYGIAEAVLKGAVEALAGGDDDKIALIYWLGRSLEAQRRTDEALKYYERALAVDITFLDLADRIQRLMAEKVR